MAAADYSGELRRRVAAATAAANRAEQRTTEICNCAASAAQSFNQMQTTETAQAYMTLAVMEVLAKDASDQLDRATAKAAEVRQAVADAGAPRQQTRDRRDQAQQAQDAARALLNDIDELNNPADGPALLGHAKAATDQAELAVTAAKPIAVEQPGQPAIGATAIDAAGLSGEAMNEAANNAKRIAVGAQNLPQAAPASCNDPQGYLQVIQNVQAQMAGIAIDRAPVAARGAALGSVDVPTQRVKDLAQIINQKAERVAALKNRDIYKQAAMRIPERQFFDDVGKSQELARIAADEVATPVGDAADAVAQSLNAMDQHAAQVANDTQALKARLDTIRQLAHDGADLIPYDPAANSTAAKGALDELERAASRMPGFAQDAQEAGAPEDIDQLWADTKLDLERQLKEKFDEARRNAGPVKSVVHNARMGLADVSVVMQSCPGSMKPGKRAKLQSAMDDVVQLKKSIATLDKETKVVRPIIAAQEARIQQSKAQAEQCFANTKASADQAVDRRIEQLEAEGHGPQRHEGGPSTEVLAERAVYGIDPETRTQLDSESGKVHSAAVSASKFKTKAVFVKAEALARAVVRAPDVDEVEVLLSALGTNVAQGVDCTMRPGNGNVSGGKAIEIPVLTQAQIDERHQAAVARQPAGAPALAPPAHAYVYDGTHPPPERDQMDQQAMRAEIAKHTKPTVFGPNAHAFAVLRTDARGKVYLRTMWPQNPE